MPNSVAHSPLELIGHTPVVRLNRLPGTDDAEVWAKLESFNPGGSVKDRICVAMVEAAEREGRLKPGDTIVEPTSGNTGIGLALVAAVKGYELILTMPDTMSEERRSLLAAYGARLVLTPDTRGMHGAIAKAQELVRENPGYFMPQQFRNHANPDVHYATTGPELAGQLDVAIVAGKHLFGEIGGRIVGALICLGLVSSISAMTWIGPRVTMTMGEDMSLLRIFARKSKQDVPVVAIIFQLLVANLLLLTQSFEAVLDFIQFSLTFCSFFTVLGVIKMRITHPQLERPYRAWGYPVTPLVFLAVTLFVMYYLVTNRPLQSLGGSAMMLAGLVIYYASRLFSRVPPSSSDASRPVPLKVDALDRA